MMRAILHIDGMMCVGCEDALSRTLGALDGVRVLTADFTRREVRVEYDDEVTVDAMREAVDASGYTFVSAEIEREEALAGEHGAPDAAGASGAPDASEPSEFSAAPASSEPASRPRRNFTAPIILIILVGLYIVADQLGILSVFNIFPTVGTERMGLVALFVTGLLTSVHCIAMCGGINLAQSMAGEAGHPLAHAVAYNAGRLVSYTIIGGLLGLLGSALAITVQVRGVIGAIAGVAMVVLGIGMLGNFSFMKKLSPRLPAPVSRVAQAIAGKGSFAVGLVNGFMPCGPLQAMQLYAIASGGFVAGATSMFAFCLGTVPLMFAFSGVVGLLRASWKKVMMQVSSVVIMALGVVLAGNSLSVAGVNLPDVGAMVSSAMSCCSSDGDADDSSDSSADAAASGVVVAEMQDDGTQLVVTQLHEDGYESIQVQVGVPVVWIIEAEEGTLNGCNGEILVNEYGLDVALVEGENVIEFTPDTTGTYSFSCWMGMLHGTIEVVE